MSTGGGLVAQPARWAAAGGGVPAVASTAALMWRMELGCILADGPGLGAVQLIALLAAFPPARGRPHLVVAPASVLDNWLRELRAWCPSLRAAVPRAASPGMRPGAPRRRRLRVLSRRTRTSRATGGAARRPRVARPQGVGVLRLRRGAR